MSGDVVGHLVALGRRSGAGRRALGAANSTLRWLPSTSKWLTGIPATMYCSSGVDGEGCLTYICSALPTGPSKLVRTARTPIRQRGFFSVQLILPTERAPLTGDSSALDLWEAEHLGLVLTHVGRRSSSLLDEPSRLAGGSAPRCWPAALQDGRVTVPRSPPSSSSTASGATATCCATTVSRRSSTSSSSPTAVPQDGARAGRPGPQPERIVPEAWPGRGCSGARRRPGDAVHPHPQELGKRTGTLGRIFRKAQNRIRDPAKCAS